MFPAGRVPVFARSALVPRRALAPRQCSRNMATAQQLKARIVTVTNIGKITKAMKMVAAAKLRAVQARLAGVRAFQAPITNAYVEKSEYPGKKHLIVALTSDRGLCGAVNSAVVKAVKNLVAESKTKGHEVQILLTGEKGKAGLERLYKQYFCEVFTEVGKSRPVTFPEASLIAEHVLAQEFDFATIFYNQFKSAIAYNTTAVPFPNLQTFLADDDQFLKYETENEPFYTLADFHQYRLAVRLFHFFSENATSEQSARMTAMENSSKNSKEMLEKLRLQYNRTRQAKITTELIEIISGASSLKAAK